jgi:cytidylate kinase
MVICYLYDNYQIELHLNIGGIKMEQTKSFVITISRQLGSGGAYIGQQVASKMNVFFADREIIRKAAKQLSILEENLESREEKRLSFWHSLTRISPQAGGVYMAPVSPILEFTDDELFAVESNIIKHIADEGSAVLIGRCGFDVLRQHPNHISIFMHADNEFRNERIQEMYHLSHESAEKMIEKSDKERAAYCKTFTGKEWADARNYDICIDTGKLGVDKAVELILNYLQLTPVLEIK